MATDLLKIYRLGDDQFASHYNVVFPDGIPLSSNSGETLILRSKEFKVSGKKLETYELVFRGLKYEETCWATEEKKFELEFRIPLTWDIYTDLKRWLDGGHDDLTGGRLPSAALRTSVYLQPINVLPDGTEAPSRSTIIYQYVKLQGLGDLTFSHEGKEMKCIASFIYIKKIDTQY